jgi:hypothetical protein
VHSPVRLRRPATRRRRKLALPPRLRRALPHHRRQRRLAAKPHRGWRFSCGPDRSGFEVSTREKDYFGIASVFSCARAAERMPVRMW